MAARRSISRFRERRAERRASRNKARLFVEYCRPTTFSHHEHNTPVRISFVGHERRELRRLARAQTSEQRLVERAKIVMLAHEGRNNSEIADILGCDIKTVRKWRSRFAANGMN